MPVLILPYGRLADQASMTTVTENIRNLFSNPQLVSSLTNVENPSNTIYSMPNLNPSVSMQENTTYMQNMPTSISDNNEYSAQMRASFQQTSPSLCNNLVDVSTATMRLADSYTQTDRLAAAAAAAAQCYQNQQQQNLTFHNQQQHHHHQQQQQNNMLPNQNNLKADIGNETCEGIPDIFFDMIDSCIGTSPTLCSVGNSPLVFHPNMSNVGTYMQSPTSIGLQYVPMSSHGTMTTHPQFIRQPSISDGFMQQRLPEMQSLSEFDSMINVESHNGFIPNQIMSSPSIVTSVCLSSSPQFDPHLSVSPPVNTRVSYPNWSTPMMRPMESTACLSAQPADFMRIQPPPPPPQHHQSMNGFVNAPISYNYEAADTCFGYDNSSSWAQVNLGSEPLINKSVEMGTCPPSANSVAVETTMDLTNFDPLNSGNCCWPLVDNFSNMETQTMGGSGDEFDALWRPNSVETQTAYHHRQQHQFLHQQQQTGWSPINTRVCVGINTDSTLENGSPCT